MFTLELNTRERFLLDLLLEIPANMTAAECYLRNGSFTPSEVTRVAITYAGECFCEAGDLTYEQNIPHTEDVISGLHSTSILEVIHLLLQYGLEPNGIYEDFNIMDSLQYVDNGYLAADALALLLEHGGNPDLMQPSEGEPFFDAADFKLFFDGIEQYDRQRFDSFVHFWMVVVGYRNKYHDGRAALYREYNSSEYFDLRKLKNHRNYSFSLIHMQNDFAISIYENETRWEVARFW